MEEAMKPRVKLASWSFVELSSRQLRLIGIPQDHPHLGSGRRIITSRVLRMDLMQGLVETLNTIYLLEDD